MKTIVSRPMEKVIKTHFPDLSVSYVEMDQRSYSVYVDYDIFRNEKDFVPSRGKMKAIRIVYPDNYFALPRYITTRDLIRAGTASDGTMSSFLREIEKLIEI